MREPILLMLTDIHLTGENSLDTEDLMNQAFSEVESLGFDELFVLGDIFDSRKAQTLKALESWMFILDRAKERNIMLRVIPGNHDKPSYKSERSYLDIYSRHPAMDLTRDHSIYERGGFKIHMVPFFDEKDIFPKYLDRARKDAESDTEIEHILMTHVAVDGVRNNDGSLIEGSLSGDAFKTFSKVFVGHYHDYQEIGDIIYIGSIKQKNFGEDSNKGFTTLNKDGSWSQLKSLFKEYKTVKIDLNTITESRLKSEMDKYGMSQDNVRFKITGTRERLKSLDRSKFSDIGIDIKCDYEDPEVIIDYVGLSNFEGFNSESIKKEWLVFSEKNTIENDVEKSGRELLNSVLK